MFIRPRIPTHGTLPALCFFLSVFLSLGGSPIDRGPPGASTAFAQNSPFIWGAAFSAHQTEGGNDQSDWWDWEHAPGHIAGDQSTEIATDHWNRYGEDFELAQNIGLQSVRISLSWARLEPEPGVFDQTAIEHYKQVLLMMHLKGLTPMVALHHFVHPRWFHAAGGWASPQAPQLFARFAAMAAREFGPLVPMWITFNEPMVQVVEGYLKGNYPPGVRSFETAVLAYANLVRAHGLAARELRAHPAPSQGLPFHGVGLALNTHAFYASHSGVLSAPAAEDLAAIEVLERLYYSAFLEAAQTGQFHWQIPPIKALPLLPQGHNLDLAIPEAAHSLDWIGVNYYNPWIIARDRSNDLGIRWITPTGSQTDLGWVIDAAGLEHVLGKINLHNSDHLPLVVTENGIADAGDTQRQKFIEQHITATQRARAAGIDVRGYYYWSLTDNFEWLLGYGPRFGLIGINYRSGPIFLNRSVRPSALWLRDYLKTITKP